MKKFKAKKPALKNSLTPFPIDTLQVRLVKIKQLT